MTGADAKGGPLPLVQWSAADVMEHISLADTAVAVAETLRVQRDGLIEQPPRMSLGDGRILIMAARSGGTGDTVVKAVRVNADGVPDVPGVDGLVLWSDASGRMSVASAHPLTILRTAAMASLATDVLAPDQVDRIAILGAGPQAHRQVEAVTMVRDVAEVVVWNRSPERGRALVEQLASESPGIRVRLTRTASDAVRGSAVVCCATAALDPLFDLDSLEPETHVNAIGAYRPDMHELPPSLLADATLVSVDDLEGCLVESGEIVDAVAAGTLHPSDLVPLTELLSNRPTRSGRTVFKSVGMAAADFAVASLLQVRTR